MWPINMYSEILYRTCDGCACSNGLICSICMWLQRLMVAMAWGLSPRPETVLETANYLVKHTICTQSDMISLFMSLFECCSLHYLTHTAEV
ncbi:hypothetical protein GDO81_012838 [Engystomops pustulosus]|uniref:Uncharacterized protein n=1 Tax=Engystomops pustulosus TaxID=76066 RepID=A0AAV7AV33_ENGPU|nr:hypothetical protein GDO81_012838 [Engystomops pustulosus]